MFQIELHENKEEYITRSILKNGYWEKHSSELVHEILKKNKLLFIDIGANIGYYSLLAASIGIKSIAFEPIKKNYRIFEKSIKKNNFQDLIKLYKVALGEEHKMVEFNIITRNMGASTIYDFIDKVEADYKENVMVFVGDDLLLPIEEDMFIKMDVENMEVSVIKGMIRTLSKGRVKYILMEISKVVDQIELFTILKKSGFHKGISIEYLKRYDSSNTLNLCSDYLSKENIYVEIEEFEKSYRTSDDAIQYNILFVRD
jgi:FkbM family methyltransferase